MPRTSVLPIMPKEVRTARTSHTVLSIPYPTPGSANSSTARQTSIWSTEDDNRLLQARAAESSWQLVSDKYFPGKTPNACRKRYERLVERRNVEDWDVAKRSLLAQEYLQMRRELWEPLAIKMGVKWTVVEAKCMGLGLKQLQATARIAERKEAAGTNTSYDTQGTSDRHSDSGIGLGSDTEMDVVDGIASPGKSASWAQPETRHSASFSEHSRSRSLPQPLPLYQPPPPIITQHRGAYNAPMTTSPETTTFTQQVPYQRYSPECQNGRGGISIQSVLAPAEPHYRPS